MLIQAKIFEELQTIEKDVESATGVLVLKDKGYTELTGAQL